VHPRIAVSAVCSWDWSLDEDLAFWARAGIGHVGLHPRKLEAAGWDAAIAAARSANLTVSSVGSVGYFPLDRPEKWAGAQGRVQRCVDVASALDARCVLIVSGGAGRLTWEEAADALGAALAPCAGRGAPLAIENTASLRTDYSFVHTLRDAHDLATMLGIGVCMEVNSCWAERGLASTVERIAPDLCLVQVSDFVSGSTTTPDRAVIGEGDVPFDRIIGDLLEAGYDGPFEVELFGPRIDAVGYEDAILRSVERLDAILARLGA
jgi:sugar phosphate isomerase/epimerase